MSNAFQGFATGAASGAASGAMVGGPYGAAIGGIVGGISGMLQGKEADRARSLAKMQARLKAMETGENLRRMRLEAQQMLGVSRAAIGASNIQFSGSAKRHHYALMSQAAADRAWVQESARIEQRIIRKGGQAASRGIMTGLYTDQIRMLGSAASQYWSPAMMRQRKGTA